MPALDVERRSNPGRRNASELCLKTEYPVPTEERALCHPGALSDRTRQPQAVRQEPNPPVRVQTSHRFGRNLTIPGRRTWEGEAPAEP